MKSFLSNLRKKSLSGEDEEVLSISFRAGLSASKINEFEREKNNSLPKDLKEFYNFSDGMDFFGEVILPLEETEIFDANFLSFHSWGNGDFDCISINNKDHGAIYFRNHENGFYYFISASIFKWLQQAYAEINQKGALLHPKDYINKQGSGMYSHVSVPESVKQIIKNEGLVFHNETTEASDHDILTLLSFDIVRILEDRVCKTLGFSFYNGSTNFYIPIIKRYIIDSGIKIDEIINFYENRGIELENFIVLFHKKQNSSGTVPVGFSIGFCIYFMLLDESDIRLIRFLKKQKIPDIKTALSEFKSAKLK